MTRAQEEAAGGKLRKTELHVSRAVLRTIPYFEPQLSGRWEGTATERGPGLEVGSASGASVPRLEVRELRCL